jgi:NAD(P)-dependent dehydrogenase (short-subunit alcohol dehydrogenase family)
VEKAVKATIEKYGRIDYLINGAAGNFLSPFENLSPNAFRTVIEIDLIGKQVNSYVTDRGYVSLTVHDNA